MSVDLILLSIAFHRLFQFLHSEHALPRAGLNPHATGEDAAAEHGLGLLAPFSLRAADMGGLPDTSWSLEGPDAGPGICCPQSLSFPIQIPGAAFSLALHLYS